jgi:transposase
MVVVSEIVHPRGLSWQQQRRVAVLRETQKLTWLQIARKVTNLKGERPYWKVCRDVYKRLGSRRGRVKLGYHRCGRKAKVTPELRAWLVKTARANRNKMVCTSVVLQRMLAKEKGVSAEASTIRRALKSAGYRWLPRARKPKHSTALKAERLEFAREVLRMTPAQLAKKLNFAMDGVVLSIPPKDPLARESFCHLGDTHVWRKPGEGNDESVCGGDRYSKQVPASRAVPLWAGISVGGCSVVLWHEQRKTKATEWAAAVDKGCLASAILAVNPDRARGPWNVLCDNEAFLRAGPSRDAHRGAHVRLWKLPARSPDLNPIEKFWAWLRKRLRELDLADLVSKRPVLGKVAFRRRVRNVLSSARAKQVAAQCVRGLRRVARDVVRKRGAATSG